MVLFTVGVVVVVEGTSVPGALDRSQEGTHTAKSHLQFSVQMIFFTSCPNLLDMFLYTVIQAAESWL